MVANAVRGESESDVLVILMGREVDPELAGLLHQDGSVTESELQGVVNEEASSLSSLTSPSLLFRDKESSDINSLASPSCFRDRGDEQGLPPAERLESGTCGVEQETRTQDDFAANWDVGWVARRIWKSAAYRSIESEASWETPSDFFTPAVRRDERLAGLRYETERTRYWSSACIKLQRMWRLRRVDIMHPRSVAAALEAMHKSPDMNAEGHEHIARWIAEYMTGVPSSQRKANSRIVH